MDKNTCPVLVAFHSVLSRRMTDEEIAKLPSLTDTKDPAKEHPRAHFLVLKSIHEIAPAILAEYGRSTEIEILGAIPKDNWTKDHISTIEKAGRASSMYIIRNTLANVVNGISAIVHSVGTDEGAAAAAAYVAVNSPIGIKKGILVLKKTRALSI